MNQIKRMRLADNIFMVVAYAMAFMSWYYLASFDVSQLWLAMFFFVLALLTMLISHPLSRVVRTVDQLNKMAGHKDDHATHLAIPIIPGFGNIPQMLHGVCNRMGIVIVVAVMAAVFNAGWAWYWIYLTFSLTVSALFLGFCMLRYM